MDIKNMNYGVSAVAASVVMADVLQWTMDGVADKIFYMAKLANIDIPEKYEIRRKVIVALIIALVLSCSWVFIPTAL